MYFCIIAQMEDMLKEGILAFLVGVARVISGEAVDVCVVVGVVIGYD